MERAFYALNSIRLKYSARNEHGNYERRGGPGGLNRRTNKRQVMHIPVEFALFFLTSFLN